jgi:hypothetical protein
MFPKLEDDKESENFTAEMELCKIDPRYPKKASDCGYSSNSRKAGVVCATEKVSLSYV